MVEERGRAKERGRDEGELGWVGSELRLAVSWSVVRLAVVS